MHLSYSIVIGILNKTTTIKQKKRTTDFYLLQKYFQIRVRCQNKTYIEIRSCTSQEALIKLLTTATLSWKNTVTHLWFQIRYSNKELCNKPGLFSFCTVIYNLNTRKFLTLAVHSCYTEYNILYSKIFYLLSSSVLTTTTTDGGPSPFTVKATTEILYLTNSPSPLRLA